MITPQILTEYVQQVLTDAQVTVTDRTGTMDHLNVRVISCLLYTSDAADE